MGPGRQRTVRTEMDGSNTRTLIRESMDLRGPSFYGDESSVPSVTTTSPRPFSEAKACR